MVKNEGYMSIWNKHGTLDPWRTKDKRIINKQADKKEPINPWRMGSNPAKQKPNEQCECGSGKKFKRCHGR